MCCAITFPEFAGLNNILAPSSTEPQEHIPYTARSSKRGFSNTAVLQARLCYDPHLSLGTWVMTERNKEIIMSQPATTAQQNKSLIFVFCVKN